MASTWSALKIELLETGQNSGQWGNLTNVNLGDAVLGEAITGQATVDFATDADVTITLTDSATTQAARNLRLNITESSTGIGSVRNLILGSGCQIEKFYLINNTGTGAKTVKNTSGTGISVPAGKATLVFNNGTNVVDAASYFTSLTLGSALPVASGGTGLTAGTSGGIPAYTATGTLTSSGVLAQYGVVIGGGAGAVPTSTAVGTATHVLTSNGSGVAPTFQALPAGGVTTFTAGTTGFTPSTATTGAVTLAGTLATTNGGTGLTSFTANGVPYASSTSVLTTGSGLLFDGTNMGLGVTPSAWSASRSKIQFSSAGTIAGFVGCYDGSGANNQMGFGSNCYLSGAGWIYNNTGAASYFSATNGTYQWNQAASGTAGNAITFTQAMTLDASGQLAIGNTSPAAKLEVYQVGLGSSVLPFYAHRSNAGIVARFVNEGFGSSLDITATASNNILLQAASGDVLSFSTNGSATAHVTISTTGGFSVGTASDPGAGAIYATGAITAFFSDQRLKTVSGKIENALDKVAKLSGVYYTFNDTAKSFGYDSDEEHVGVLAQEVEAVLPQIVKAAPFDLDENNNSKSGEHYKTVQYEKLVPLLIEAINELQAKVKLLENK